MKKGFNLTAEFKNYKKLGKEEVKKISLEDVNVVIVEGGNGQGKTSTIVAFREAIQCKALTSAPVTEGEFEGYTKITIPDKDGNECTIIHNFDTNNPKGEFICINKDGKYIKSVKEMRDILGTYDDLSVEQLFSLALTIPGRRNIIDTYLKPCLEEEASKELKVLEDNHKRLYDDRTQKNKEHGASSILLQQFSITDEQLTLLKKKDSYNDGLKKLQEYYDVNTNGDTKVKEVTDAKNKYTSAYQVSYTEKYELLQDYQKQLEELKLKISSLETNLVAMEEKYISDIEVFSNQLKNVSIDEKFNKEDVEKRIETGKTYLKEIEKIEQNQINLQEQTVKYEELYLSIVDINDKLTKIEERKKVIFSESKLPAGLSFDGDDIYINGFPIAESQISESEMKLAWLELKCRINTSRIIVLGNIAAFGEGRLDDIIKIAEANGKIVLLEKVVDDEREVKLIGLIED